MRIFKRIILIIITLTIVGFLFRGVIYRNIITYKSIGQRKNYEVKEKQLVDFYETELRGKINLEIREIIKIGLKVTREQLNFTVDKNEINPNKLIKTRNSHCVGYASFFATTCNYLIEKNNLSETWIAKPQIGQIYFFDKNIHEYFSTSFFKDHDFVIIENIKNGETFAVDPTLNDYFYINFISYKE